VDATSHVDKWPDRLLRLDNQTRSNARDRAVSRNDVSRPLRRRFLPVAGHGWYPKTVTKAHFKRYPGDHGVCVDGHTAA